MKYRSFFILIVVTILLSGCLEGITNRFQEVNVAYVNVTVVEQDNITIIQDFDARMGVVSKLNAPGLTIPEKYPAIYAELTQVYNISKPTTFKSISAQSGQIYNGPGKYSFTITLFQNEFNSTQPLRVYSEIILNQSKRLTRNSSNLIYWTE